MTQKAGISRRDFMGLVGASALVAGCATNPVTGKSQLMLVSESQEISLDKEGARHQFSAHYGATQDRRLNEYVISVGSSMVPGCHRPHMPYSFRVVNSPVVNGYTFPAGSVALARGLMLEMGSESQLAAVLGHEIGHVCARHTGSRMSWAMMSQVGVVLLAAYLEEEHRDYAVLGAGLGMVGANMLLCRYSRDDERQADSLGLRYMTNAGYNPEGMSELMQIFMDLHKGKPNVVELLFATHPMSDERHANAKREIAAKYRGDNWKDNRERYMENIGGLRKIAGAIRQMQEGEALIMQGKFAEAEERLSGALKAAPDDYAGLMLMGKALYGRKQHFEAERYVAQAHSVYPTEAQALHLTGMIQLERRKYGEAFASFDDYEKLLPGNPNTVYLKGSALDGQDRKKDAADHYMKYLQQSPGGEYAEAAKKRLKSWGYKIPGEQV